MISGLAMALATVMVIPGDVVRVPFVFRNTAERICEPFDVNVEFQVIRYGADVTSGPRLAPSSLNWTAAIPALLVAEAEMTIAAPETMEPLLGAVTLISVTGTDGGVTFGGGVTSGASVLIGMGCVETIMSSSHM
jgi:hypothetical protein